MKRTIFLLGALAMAAGACNRQPETSDWAVTKVTRQELQASDAWIKSVLPGEKGPPAFSFIYNGKPSSELLPHWTRKSTTAELDAFRTQHVLTWSDPDTKVEVVCTATQYRDFPAVEYVLHITNKGDKDSPILDNILPLDTAVALGEKDAPVLHYSKGDVFEHVDSYIPFDKPLADNETVAMPGGKIRAQTFLPYFNLETGSGGVVGGIGWTGQWALNVQRKGKQVKLQAGQQLTHLLLHPGESIRTPAILLLHWQGGDRMRGHNFLRRLLVAHYLPRINGVVATVPIAVGDGTLNDFTEKMEIDAINSCKNLGVECFWRDAGWFEGGWPDGAGSWVTNTKYLPNGWGPVVRACRDSGMKFLLWFEPERVTAASRIFKEHPKWVLTQQDGGWTEPGNAWDGMRAGLFNLGDPDARTWMTDLLDKCITDWGIDIYRQDRNTQPVWYWRANDTPDRQGITEIRHVEGLYAMWDELRRRHPALIIDNANWRCTGPDFEMARRSSGSFTRSETAGCGGNPIANQVQTSGLSLYLPLHGSGLYEPTPYQLRSQCTTGFGSGFLPKWAAQDPDNVRKLLAEIRLIRPLALGDFYPLTSVNADKEHWMAWQFHREDLQEGVAIALRRPESPYTSIQVQPKGLVPTAQYDVDFRESFDVQKTRRMSGRELSELTVQLISRPSSMLVHYRIVK